MLLLKLERGFEAQTLMGSDEVVGMPDKIFGLLQVLQGIYAHSVDVFVLDGSVDSLTVGIFIFKSPTILSGFILGIP